MSIKNSSRLAGALTSLACCQLCLALSALGAGPAPADFPGKGSLSNWYKANAQYNSGITLGEQGRLDGAIERFKYATEIYPYDKRYWNNLGYAQMLKGDFALAESNVKKALSLDAKCTTCWMNMGEVLFKQGRHQEARSAYLSALSCKPDEDQSRMIRGNLSALDALLKAAKR